MDACRIVPCTHALQISRWALASFLVYDAPIELSRCHSIPSLPGWANTRCMWSNKELSLTLVTSRRSSLGSHKDFCM